MQAPSLDTHSLAPRGLGAPKTAVVLVVVVVVVVAVTAASEVKRMVVLAVLKKQAIGVALGREGEKIACSSSPK